MMNGKTVTGTGGIFFRCDDSGMMTEWYGKDIDMAARLMSKSGKQMVPNLNFNP